MRDGVRLAVDLSLPKGLPAGERLPALFAATRYWRTQQLRVPFAWFLSPPDTARDFFCAYGYALLRIDVRGTGASEGNQPHPWPDTDLSDLYDLVAWVVQQPWSDGRVNAFGNSYQATMAEILGACGHPAVSAALVRFNEFDVYTDIAFPGGVPNRFILSQWAEYNRALDANRLPVGASWLERLMVRGVKPVGRQPIPPHANRQVDSVLRSVTFRDDVDPDLGVCIDAISVHARQTSHAIDHWGSWFDAATADAVIRRFTSNPRPQRAVIGAWNHGGRQQVGAEKNPFPLLAQMQEALRFLDAPPATRQLHYYTLFEEQWHTTTDWPPQGFSARNFYLQANGGLAVDLPPSASVEHFRLDFEVSSGRNNRWQTELDQRPVRYPAALGQVVFTSQPLEEDYELTGYPVVDLYLRSTHPDGAVIVYLQTLDVQGGVHYLSEGALRVIHRKLTAGQLPRHSFRREDALPLTPGETARLAFTLQPISALLRRGWRLRVSLAGADRDTFARIPASGEPQIDLLLGGETASSIELPLRAH